MEVPCSPFVLLSIKFKLCVKDILGNMRISVPDENDAGDKRYHLFIVHRLLKHSQTLFSTSYSGLSKSSPNRTVPLKLALEMVDGFENVCLTFLVVIAYRRVP